MEGSRAQDGGQGAATAGPLVERVAEFYHKALFRGSRGLKHLAKLALEEAHLLESHRIGHCDGTLAEILPESDPKRQELQRLGLLVEADGKLIERFMDHIVVPLTDAEEGVVALWGLSIKTGETGLIPPAAPPLWNLPAARLYPEILLCGTVIEGLSLARAGFPNVMALAAEALRDEDAALLQSLGVQKVALLGGRETIQRLRPVLSRFQLATILVAKNHSLNSRLVSNGETALVRFVETKLKAAPVEQPSTDAGTGAVAAVEDGINASFGARQYLLRAIEKTARRLRATLRTEFRGKLHVDTLDFYNARCRKSLAQDLCRLFEESAAVIETDIGRLIKLCESREPGEKEPESSCAVILSPAERAEAEAFGKRPDLLDKVAEDFEHCGLIGEKSNKLISYLAAVSRKLDDPLSILILSSSGAGKTALQDATLLLCPPEDVVKLTSLTGKALFYKGRTSLKHKILAVEEGAGAEDATYAIRNLVSAKELVIEAAVKDFTTGRITTMENRVEGPTAVFITTTDPEVDPETRSRFIVLTVDESREQTRAILAAQRKRQTLEAVTARESVESVLRRHRNFQRLLKPLLVVNPFAVELEYSDDRLQSRRDHPKYLNLIKAVAFLSQMSRPVKRAAGKDGQTVNYVEVTRQDIEAAGKLMQEAFGRNPDDLNGVSRALLAQVERMVTERAEEMKKTEGGRDVHRSDITFTRREIREYTGWSHMRVLRYLKQLVDFEYITAVHGRNGIRFFYSLTNYPAEAFARGGQEVQERRGA